MTRTENIVNTIIKGLIFSLCRVEGEELKRVPDQGPLIVYMNHINFLDAPLFYTHLRPRPLTGFVKSETWDSPFLGPLFTLWGAIPLRRGEADMSAIRQGVSVLEEGKILAIAPEGTRSEHGRLRVAHAGTVMMALLSGAPLLPLAHFGTEKFRHNLPRLRRTRIRIRVGDPFRLDNGGKRATREIREKMTEEIMYHLAAMLPPSYRGEYAELSKATRKYMRFVARK
ncbi:MAG: 1-acyl-sn-glycerol-3-phosphate acyltransferase [Chloroflexi bacterium]|nr:1-acyl-sn-glycerol-3-phosphate acyltransferase [Chloroflexota bacterium]